MSSDPSDDELRALHFSESRISCLEGLEAFVSDGAPPTAGVQAALDHAGYSRWYPVAGGHRVLIRYEGAWPFAADELVRRPGAWDHEHCDRCGETIPPMTLCWASVADPLILLCTDCRSTLSSGPV